MKLRTNAYGTQSPTSVARRPIRWILTFLALGVCGATFALGQGPESTGLLGLSAPSQEEQEALSQAARETAELTVASLREARAERELVARAGEWESGRFASEKSSWQVRLERDRATDELRGAIRVDGSYALREAARIEGKLEESSASGVILDDGGTTLGTFTGTVTAEGMSGSYRTAAGDEGTWSYRDWRPEPLPQHLRDLAAARAASDDADDPALE
jgi:hypothetical protein